MRIGVVRMRLSDEEEESSLKYMEIDYRNIVEWRLIYDVGGECSFLLSQYLHHTSIWVLEYPQPGSASV